MNNVWIIAQAGEGQTPQTITSEPITSEGQTATAAPGDVNNSVQQKQTTPNSLLTWLFPVIMVFLIFLMFRAPQKQKQQRKKLEQSLEKNDRVLTIGGIFGTIVDIKDDEVVLKIDESNNTKIRITRSAIGRNVSKD